MSTVAEPSDLRGKVALVTGGTRGLGHAIVLGLANAGADVVVSSRKQAACDAVAAEVRGLGRRALACPCHMARWEEVDALADAAYAEFGRVDVLVNNAGISPAYPDPASITQELWDKVLAVNLGGPFRLTAVVAPRMAAGDGGSVINISSIGAWQPQAGVLPYAAAKAGLNALTIGFADAYGPGVRVNCILPGPFFTDMSEGWDMRQFDDSARYFPLRRGGRPEEIVGTVLYFAGAQSSFTTGALLPVDGGALLGRPVAVRPAE